MGRKSKGRRRLGDGGERHGHGWQHPDDEASSRPNAVAFADPQTGDTGPTTGAVPSSLKRASPHGGPGDADDQADQAADCDTDKGDGGWQTIQNGRPSKKLKKTPQKESGSYPSIVHAPTARLQAKIQVSDLRNLILYIFADGPPPQWVSVAHRPSFRKIVVVMVPGLEEAMFKKATDLSRYEQHRPNPAAGQSQVALQPPTSPDDYYPRRLQRDDVSRALQPFADMFPHLWPIKATGNDRIPNMHSPITTMLTTPLPKQKDDRERKGPRPATAPASSKDVRTRITEFIATSQEYLQNEFLVHPAMLPDADSRAAFQDEPGWFHTRVETLEDGSVPEAEIQQGSITAGRDVYAIDCEMCKTGETEFSLTRISIVAWDGEVILDELVKPDKPITDYLTQYSGITEEMLKPITMTLRSIQERLLALFNARSVLVGHSLDSDMKAMQLTHPFIVDTSIIYPHPAGPGKKHALKWLAQKYLNREIQKGHGTVRGHDSIEDARTCLDLVKMKCEKGKLWANGEGEGENLFKRLARTGTLYRSQGGPHATGGARVGKSSAAVDWGDLRRSLCAEAGVTISCRSDAEVERGIARAVRGDPDGVEVPGGGVDFVWARMRELEALRGWWNRNKTTAQVPLGPSSVAELEAIAQDATSETAVEDDAAPPATAVRAPAESALEICLGDLAERLKRIYEDLPPCTAFIVFSGSGDPREMSRLQAQRAQHKKEYHTPGVNWDQISVPWAEAEEDMLRQANKQAREGIGFVTVK